MEHGAGSYPASGSIAIMREILIIMFMVFEATLKGFNGATDETDYLILWIKAPNLKSAQQAIKARGLELQQSLEEIPESANVPDEAIDIVVE